mmetsp:Transcript_23040/g.23421  ORF Transcript_23040/g.23421 Transcript_23040/m.23421 type:complete len:91 (+) Transcript_23040:185-457(+)
MLESSPGGSQDAKNNSQTTLPKYSPQEKAPSRKHEDEKKVVHGDQGKTFVNQNNDMKFRHYIGTWNTYGNQYWTIIIAECLSSGKRDFFQ